MTSRERVLRAIKSEGPDRVPVIHGQTPGALLKYGNELLELLRKHPNEFYDVDGIVKIPEREEEFYGPDGGFYKEQTDEWGVVWAFCEEGLVGQVIKTPIEEWGDSRRHQFPRPLFEAVEQSEPQRKLLSTMKERGYPGWGDGGTLFQQLAYLRGFDNILVDIIVYRQTSGVS